jgi:hypothetical protein
MGFIVVDSIEVGQSGVTLDHAYVAFGRETLRLRGNSDGTYTVECMAKLYKSKAAYNNGKAPLDSFLAQEILNENQLNGNLFRRLYNILKARFSQTQDD